jgi:hypothetical protein
MNLMLKTCCPVFCFVDNGVLSFGGMQQCIRPAENARSTANQSNPLLEAA